MSDDNGQRVPTPEERIQMLEMALQKLIRELSGIMGDVAKRLQHLERLEEDRQKRIKLV